MRSGVRYSRWRAVGPVEPRRYDGGLFHRHRRQCHFIRASGNPLPDRTDPDSRRRLCRDLLPARVVEGRSKTGMVLSANEVFGNLGVAVAALLTSYLIDTVGWRSPYFVPGAFSVLVGIGYMLFSIVRSDFLDKALLIGVFAFLVFCVAAFVIFPLSFSCRKPGRSETHLLMPEVPHAGENHRKTGVVGGGDDFFVSD